MSEPLAGRYFVTTLADILGPNPKLVYEGDPEYTRRVRQMEEDIRQVREAKKAAKVGKQPQPARPPVWTVYFVQQVADDQFIKIGTALDVSARVDSLQTSSPYPLRILGVIPAVTRDVEKKLHKKFATALVRGEWFRPTADLLEYIRTNTVQHEDPRSQAKPTAV